MLRGYASFAEASRAADVQTYLTDLRANYPLDQARDLLNTLRSEDEQPAPAAPRAIPPTAPLLDINAAENERPIYPLQIDAAPQRPQRPRAQPAPARAAAPAAKEQPLRPIPLAAPEPRQGREPAPRRTTTSRAALRQERRPEGGVGWLSVTLTLLAATTGLALAAFVLARPFLPAEWLR
jgi:hypothetical protein